MNQIVDLGALDGRLVGLQRPPQSRPTSGLCRAVAERLGIDPLIVRIVTVALTLTAGLGLALYAWGTLLTPRVGMEPPIRRIAPGFERWTTTTQALVIGISTLVVVIITSTTGTTPIGPVAVLLLVVFLARSRSKRSAAAGQRWAPPSFPPPHTGSSEAPATVEEWRERIRAHAQFRVRSDDPLPAVDLYGPEPVPQAEPEQESVKVSWLGAFGVVLLGFAAGFGSLVLGIGDGVLMAMATCTLAVGAAMLLWSLFIRSRRLPTVLIAVVLAGGAITAGTAISQATPPSPIAVAEEQTRSNGTLTYEFFADDRGVVDLTHLGADATPTVNVEAFASNVRILLPGAPLEVVVDSVASTVTGVDGPPRGEEPEPTGITLKIDAFASQVSLEYP